MLTVDQVVELLKESARLLVTPESVPLFEAENRVLASDIVASIDVPPAANSAMDGYALRGADWPGPDSAMPVSQRITAGSVGTPLQKGTVARIFTGAPVPDGADTVVMQENTGEASDHGVHILELADKGANIRPQGQDIQSGNTILGSGTLLRPQELGLIASQGHAQIDCYRRLRVALLSTGDELVEPGEPETPGHIYNSNRFTVAGLLRGWGFEFVDLGIAPDDPEQIRAALIKGAEMADVVLTSGGVSVGEEDHVRAIVQSLGNVDHWKVRIKPGKPFAFGRIGETPFMGLPGNPVSVFVTLAVLARGYLMRCQGIADPGIEPLKVPARFEKTGSSREDYLRVRMSQSGVEPFSVDSSGVLNSLCWSDGLVRQRAGQDIRPGDAVDYFPFAIML